MTVVIGRHIWPIYPSSLYHRSVSNSLAADGDKSRLLWLLLNVLEAFWANCVDSDQTAPLV